jgi:hypothetical protein
MGAWLARAGIEVLVSVAPDVEAPLELRWGYTNWYPGRTWPTAEPLESDGLMCRMREAVVIDRHEECFGYTELVCLMLTAL